MTDKEFKKNCIKLNTGVVDISRGSLKYLKGETKSYWQKGTKVMIQAIKTGEINSFYITLGDLISTTMTGVA